MGRLLVPFLREHIISPTKSVKHMYLSLGDGSYRFTAISMQSAQRPRGLWLNLPRWNQDAGSGRSEHGRPSTKNDRSRARRVQSSDSESDSDNGTWVNESETDSGLESDEDTLEDIKVVPKRESEVIEIHDSDDDELNIDWRKSIILDPQGDSDSSTDVEIID